MLLFLCAEETERCCYTPSPQWKFLASPLNAVSRTVLFYQSRLLRPFDVCWRVQIRTNVRRTMADVNTSVRTRSAVTSAPVTTDSRFTTTSMTAKKVLVSLLLSTCLPCRPLPVCLVPKRKRAVPGASNKLGKWLIDWLSEWVSECAIFLEWLAQQRKQQKK